MLQDPPAMPDANSPLRPVADDRLQFETLIADLASRFVNVDPDIVDEVIEDALQRLVYALDVDRSSLFRFDRQAIVLTHYWSRPEFPPVPLNLRTPINRFPWIAARVRAGELVVFSSVDELPADVPDREQIREVGTKSNVTIPLIVSGRPIGALTFGTMREERQWPAEIVNRLRLIAQIFASALARKRAESDLRRTLAENARLRDRLQQENVYLQQEMKDRQGPTEVMGESAGVR